jgi:hypothetical protein
MKRRLDLAGRLSVIVAAVALAAGSAAASSEQDEPPERERQEAGAENHPLAGEALTFEIELVSVR